LEREIKAALEIAELPSASKFLNLKTIDNSEVKICHSFVSTRFAGVFNTDDINTDINVDLNKNNMLAIKHYCYFDNVIDMDLSELIVLYAWCLKNNAPMRFISLLLNQFIAQVNESNCVCLYKQCKKLDAPPEEFQKLLNHCLGIMKKFITTNEPESVDGLVSDDELLLAAIRSKFDKPLEKVVLPSSMYLDDLTKMFNADVSPLNLVLGVGTQVRVEPFLLVGRSEYLKTRLSGVCEHGSTIELFDIGLDRDEYNSLSERDKKLRAKALRKIIEYWCTGNLDVEIEEALIALDLCTIFDVKEDSQLVKKYRTLIIDNISKENIFSLAKVVKNPHTLYLPLRNAIVEFSVKYWKDIKVHYKPECFLELPSEYMAELLLKFD
jgi:hypothetical protein